MDRIEEYKNYVVNLISKYASYKPVNVEVDRQFIVDHEHGHYQLMSVGWKGKERIHNCVIHIDIMNNKIWIQQDATDMGITDELLALGVPKEDIVLAFHPPYKRPFTGFAVN